MDLRLKSNLFPGTAFFLLIISSCGLRYHRPESPEEFQERRHAKVTEYVLRDLGRDSVSFEAIAFGTTKVIRPASFKKLDSLYALKYANEEKGIFDTELDRIIQSEKEAVQRDTVLIKYEENFVFSFIHPGDSAEQHIGRQKRFVDMDITLDHQLSVIGEKLNSSILIPDSLNEQYRCFLFEESFLYPGSFATEEETLFYTFFKEELATMEGTSKDALILHVLNIMSIAYTKKSLQTSRILHKLAQRELAARSTNRTNEEYSDIYRETDSATPPEQQGYWFTVHFQCDRQTEKEYFFRFDHLYRLVSVTEL